MRRRPDPLGSVLVRTGALTEDALKDILAAQRHTLRVGSLAYVLGHASEYDIARGLSKQTGIPAVVLDHSRIDLAVLDGVAQALCLEHNLLPVYEDDQRLFIAVADPDSASDVLREIAFMRGRTVVPHVALSITLARTLRACYAALANGRLSVAGALAPPLGETLGHMTVVSDVDTIADGAGGAHVAVLEDVTRDVVDFDGLLDGGETAAGATDTQTWPHDSKGTPPRRPSGTLPNGISQHTPLTGIEMLPDPRARIIDLDEGIDPRGERSDHRRGSEPGSPQRILIVDDDFATRHLLVKELQPHGYVTSTASNGTEAVRAVKSGPLDLVVIDVMLPEVDGFQVCRAIKQSKRYKHIAVVLMSAVIDSGRVTDDVLRRYGADAYFEKPLNTERVKRRILDLLASRAAQEPGDDDDSFEQAIRLYKRGDIDGAIGVLRAGLQVDPLSTKHHFVLANLLQKKQLVYEAIDEYEATCELKPDYFPALTRLAYLYYKKGFSAKAIETWRRSLPHCEDQELRKNIELFMRRLITEMQTAGT